MVLHPTADRGEPLLSWVGIWGRGCRRAQTGVMGGRGQGFFGAKRVWEVRKPLSLRGASLSPKYLPTRGEPLSLRVRDGSSERQLVLCPTPIPPPKAQPR